MVYIICDLNGQSINVPFVGEETQIPEGATPKYIGINKDGHSLAVSLHQQWMPLMDGDFDADTIKDDDCYTGWNMSKAMQNWNGKALTEHLLQQSSKLRAYLKEGEYVPSLPELAFICANQEELNASLKFVGGDVFIASYYWSSTGTSQNYSWYVNFSSGNFNDMYKYNSYYVRPVVAFNA